MPRNRAESARFPRDKTTFQRGQATLRRETLRSASGSDAGENTRARRAVRRRPGRRRRLGEISGKRKPGFSTFQGGGDRRRSASWPRCDSWRWIPRDGSSWIGFACPTGMSWGMEIYTTASTHGCF